MRCLGTGDHPDDDEDHDNNVVDDVEPELAETAGHLVTAGRIVLQAPANKTECLGYNSLHKIH